MTVLITTEEREVVDGGGFAGDAVVVHGVDAVGGDVHLEEVAVVLSVGADAEVMHAFYGDAAQGEVVGELPVIDGEFRQIGAEPGCENFHDGRFLV